VMFCWLVEAVVAVPLVVLLVVAAAVEAEF
jgi:hypothetical protein